MKKSVNKYLKFSKQFWINKTGIKILEYGNQTTFLAIYLLTNPHSNVLGIYHLPIPYIVNDTRLSLKVVHKGLQNLCDIGFCKYDKESGYIWICNMAYEQIGSLKETDRRIKAIQSIYDFLPNLPFLDEFYNRYSKDFHLYSKDSRSSTNNTLILSDSLFLSPDDIIQDEDDKEIIKQISELDKSDKLDRYEFI